MEERYYSKFAFAALRENLKKTGRSDIISDDLCKKEIEQISTDEALSVIDAAGASGLKIHNFKRSNRQLPRVHKVLSFLKGISFENLLDVGRGRGVFLFPFMEEFPHSPVTCIDILDKRVQLISDIRNGGIHRLTAKKASICEQPFADNTFDVVTLLEVLEHIPDVEAAVRAAVNMARKYIVVTVPSKEDSNPEHIHLLTKDKLCAIFSRCNVQKLSFDNVPGHLFMIAKIGKEQ